MSKASLRVFLFISICFLGLTAFSQNGYTPALIWEKGFASHSSANGPSAIGTSVLKASNGDYLLNYSASSRVGYIMRLGTDGSVLNESLRNGAPSQFSEQYGYKNQVSLNPDSTILFGGYGISLLDPANGFTASILKKKSYNTLNSNQEAYNSIPNSDAAISIASLPDNGYTVLYRTFNSTSATPNWDLNIARYSSTDQLIFDKKLESGGNDYGTAIRYDANGFLYIAGYTDLESGEPTGVFNGTTGALPGTFLIQTDLDGTIQWVKTTPEEHSVDIVQTSANFVYVLTWEANKISLQKNNTSGAVIWQKQLINTNSRPISVDSLSLGITALSDNNILFHYKLNPQNPGDSSYTVVEKLDANDASVIWTKNIATANWSVTYQVIEVANNQLIGVGGIKLNSGDVTADPVTYSDMRIWAYQLGPHVQGTVSCAGQIDTTLKLGSAATVCAGQTVTLTAASGLAYQWYKDGAFVNNQTTNQLIATTSGNYKVVLSNNSGCIDSSRIVAITIAPLIDTAVTISGSPSVCAGGTVTLNAAGGLNYQWYRDGAAIVSSNARQYIANTSGIYKVVLTNAEGCKDTSRNIVVSIGNTIDTTLSVSGSTTLCAGQAVKLTAAGNLAYSWYRDGVSIANQTTNELSVNSSGVYHVILTAGSGCTDTTRDVTVTVAAAIDTMVNLNGPATLCSGGTVTLSAAANLQYKWLKNGTAIAAATTRTYAASSSGTYAVVLSNGQACSDTSRNIVITIGQPIDTTQKVTGSTTFCAGQTAVLTAAPNLSYNWYRNGTLIANQSTNQLTITTSGTYHAILTAGGGCKDTTGDVTFAVGAALDTMLTLAGPATLCSGGTVTMSAAGNQQYQWYKNGTAIAGQTNATFATTNSGSYFVILSNAQSCRDTSRTIVVSIGQPIDTTLKVTGSTTFCAGQTAVLTAAPNLSYNWYRNGTLIANQTSNQLTITTSGTYHAILTAGGGCKDTTRDVTFAVGAALDTMLTLAGPATLCSGGTVTMSAAGNQQYQWYKNGTAIAGQTNATFATTNSGSYFVILSNAQSCRDTSRTIVVSIGQPIDTTLKVTGSTTFCAGQTAVLTAAPNLSYNWYRNGTLIANQTSNQLTITTSGTYHAILTAGGGCKDTTRDVTFAVGAALDTTLTLAGPATLCSGGTVTMSAAGNQQYQWYKNGTAIAGQTNATFATTSSGSYFVILSNAQSCRDTSRTVVISIGQPIDTTLTVAGSTTFCAGQSAVLSAVQGLGYTWYRNGAIISGQSTNQLTVTTAGVYHAILTAGGGCVDTTRDVTVNVGASIDTTLTLGNSPTVCAGGTVILSAAPGQIYQWYKDGSILSGQTQQTYTAFASGVYLVRLQNVASCVDSSRPVTVSIGGGLDTTLTVIGSTGICGGKSVLFQAAPNLQYKWYKDGVLIPNANGQTYAASTTGSYQAILSSNGGCSDTTRLVHVQVAAPIDTTLKVNGSLVLCKQDVVQLIAAAGLTYQWYRNGVLEAGAISATLSLNTPGTYLAVLSNALGCVDSTRAVTITNTNIDTAISLSGGPAVCAGQTVTITAAPNLTYKWHKDGQLIAGATARTYTATVTGNYQALLTTPQGCTDSSRLVAITISNNVNGAITPATASICSGNPVDLTATGGSAYQWYLNNQPITNATATVYRATQIGVYSVVIFNAGGCSGPAQNTVNVQAAVIDTSLAVNGSTTICLGKTVTLIAGTATSYQWLFNGTTIVGATAKQFNADKSGSYSVIVGSAAGCVTTSRSVVVTVSASPVAAIANPTSTTICGTTPVVLAASGGPSYAWYRNNILIANATAATYSATLSGTYTVVVANTGDCADTSNAVVLADFAKPQSGFNAVAACVGNETSFTNTSVVAGSATYSWSFGDNSTSTDKDPKHVYTTAGTYNVKLIVRVSGCQDAADSVTHQVVIGSSATGTRYATVNTSPGISVTLTARDGGSSYSWSPVTGLSSPASRVTTATLNASQEYTVQIAQSAGCNVVDTVMVNVQVATGQTQVFVPTGFTPNSNGRNDVLRPMLINMRSITYFRVYNRWGKMVFQTSAIGTGWDGRVNGAPQPRETYSWAFEGVDNSGKTIKLSGKTVLIR